jgi:hypothetical protein
MTLSDQILLQRIGTALGLDKHQREARHGREKLKDNGALLALFHHLDTLGDGFGGHAHATHGQVDVLGQKVASKTLDLRRV